VRDAVICEPLRTPVGGFGGVFRDVPPALLAATVIEALVQRTSLPAGEIDDVILGQGYPNGEAPAIGRVAALDAGLGIEVPGLQIDRRCGAGLQAIMLGCMQVQTGASELVLAGGAESMSQAEFYAMGIRWGVKGGVELADRLSRPRVTAGGQRHVVEGGMIETAENVRREYGISRADRLSRPRVTAGGQRHVVEGGMIETAENVRREYGISRADQDELALRSHQRAVAALQDGTFAEEIVPVTVRTRKQELVIDRDEHPRADTTLEKLAALRPIMSRSDPDATVTAGNASGQNDGAAICIVTHPEKAAELGLTPLARLVSWSVAGVPPETMGIGPIPATHKALQRAGLTLADLDLIELNEAFAAQALAVIGEWDLPDGLERVNVHGSGISLGHPIGATGGRIMTTLLRELRRRGGRYGLETMCIGGGQGMAAVFENFDK